MLKDNDIFITTAPGGTPQILVVPPRTSELAHFTGITCSHIFSHTLNKVVCGAKSHWWAGLNNDLNIELLQEIGIAHQISCKRCQEWFNKHYSLK
jgi:hypothetical protein